MPDLRTAQEGDTSADTAGAKRSSLDREGGTSPGGVQTVHRVETRGVSSVGGAKGPTREVIVPEGSGRKPLRLHDVVRIYMAPGSLFRRVEDTGAYGWALLVLLVVVMLIGALRVQSGLIDRDVDLQTNRSLAELESSRSDLVDRIELKKRMEDVRKAGTFQKTLRRVLEIGVAPVLHLASLLLITSILYVSVALSGRKPEFHTLMSIGVYSAYLPLLGSLLALGMTLYYRTLDVDTTLGRLGDGTAGQVLAAVDPFAIWFWVLVAFGTIVTRQLGRGVAVTVCVLMALVGMGARFGMSLAPGI